MRHRLREQGQALFDDDLGDVGDAARPADGLVAEPQLPAVIATQRHHVLGIGEQRVDGECVADVVPDDVTPPGPVTGLSASESGGTVTLSWTNPTDADFESVLVVRRGSLQVTAAPSRGVAYPDGATMTDGSLVVTTATGTSAMDATAAKGVAFYAVYARDKTGNWSAGTHVRALLPLPAQNATISITLQDGPVATVTQQPANFHLEAQARSGVRLQVRITSLVERPVFNTKIVVTSINNGTVAGNGFIGTNAYAQTAIGALWPGATRDAEDLIITEDGTVDPIVLQVQVVDDPLFIGTQIYATGSPFNFVDSRTYVGRGITCATALVPGGTPNGFCSLTSGVLSADARRLTMGMRNLPRLVTFETSSFRVVGGVDLASGLGSIAALAADASGATLYAVLNTGQHGAFGSMSPVGGRHDGDIALVKLDAATLQETARLVLRMSPNGAAQPYGKDLALSPDGKYAAIPIAGAQEVYVVDLATFTVVDTDSTMASTQPIDVTAISQGAKQDRAG